MNRLKTLIPMLMLAASMGALGCASQETRTTETTTTSQPADTSPTQPVEASQTTTTTTTNDSGHSSLLGATGNFVWTVVSLPFRVVGDIIGEMRGFLGWNLPGAPLRDPKDIGEQAIPVTSIRPALFCIGGGKTRTCCHQNCQSDF